MRITFIFVALILVAWPVSAQQKYSSWSNPDSTGSTSNETTRALLDKLNALVDEAEKSRAADPVFLRDLRNLARSYTPSRHSSSLNDDFADGNFTANPVWTVSQGRFWVEKGWGLRSAVTVQPDGEASDEQKSTSGKDLALTILGAVLNQATRNSGSGSATDSASAGQSQLAAIHSPAAISNAFSIEFEISSWESQGRFDIGPYQGTNTDTGYRLSYTPGGTLVLLRNSTRGSITVKRASNSRALEDQKSHTVLWTRDGNGLMKIIVDGRTVINARDRGFSDPFQGIAIANRGGDFIIKRISVRSID